MNFKKYNEILNTYNKKVIDNFCKYGFNNPIIEYVCVTKIDGANFQCSIDETDNFIVGSRTAFIEDDDNFLNYKRAMNNEDVQNKLRMMKKHIIDSNFMKNVAKFDDDTEKFTLTVFGELCGGYYHHPDVEPVKGAKKIQGRVDYNPDNMWIPFDIKIVNQSESMKYLFDVSTVKEFCDYVGLPSQIIKFRGTFDECINYKNDAVDDTGHILWGLPIITNNIMEGIVIKPEKAMWFGNGERVILKNKNQKFKERINKQKIKNTKNVELTKLESKYFVILNEYKTESRVYSVASKIGSIQQNLFAKLNGLFVQDLLKDFNEDYGDEIAKIEDEVDVSEFNMKKINKLIQKETASFIRPVFLKLIED